MSGYAAQPKSNGETLAAPANDSYLEIMEVHCLTWSAQGKQVFVIVIV